MRISAVGSERGFTLLELLVVVSIIALASAGVGFALRDNSTHAIEREAQRLAALLESARAQSRLTGRPIVWQASAGGFRFDGAAPSTLPQHWLQADVEADGGPLLLGPEPVIGPQRLVLRRANRSAEIGTDGVHPFALAQVQTRATEQP